MAEVQCPNCRAIASPGAAFCGNCGASFAAINLPAAAAPLPAPQMPQPQAPPPPPAPAPIPGYPGGPPQYAPAPYAQPGTAAYPQPAQWPAPAAPPAPAPAPTPGYAPAAPQYAPLPPGQVNVAAYPQPAQWPPPAGQPPVAGGTPAPQYAPSPTSGILGPAPAAPTPQAATARQMAKEAFPMRLMAFIVDALICGVASWALSFLWGSIFFLGWILLWWGGAIILAVYMLLLENSSGQTIGKMVFGLKVVREDGAPMGMEQAQWRAFGILLYPLFIPALLDFLWALEHGQTLGDRWAHTAVVRVQT